MKPDNRVNISVPANIRKRMLAQKRPPNWSRIATAAFRVWLDSPEGNPLTTILQLEAKLADAESKLNEIKRIL